MWGCFLVRNTVLTKEKAQRSSSVTSEPPAKVVKQSNKNLQTDSGNTGTGGKAQRSSSVTSEPPAKVVKQSDKNLQTGHGNPGTGGTHNSKKDSRNKIPKSSCNNTGTQGKNVSRTFKNSALAQKNGIFLPKKANRIVATQVAEILPHRRESSLHLQEMFLCKWQQRLGLKKKGEYSRYGAGRMSTGGLISKMDRGKVITCIQPVFK